MNNLRDGRIVVLGLLLALLVGCGGNGKDSNAQKLADDTKGMVEDATDAAKEAGEDLSDVATAALDEVQGLSADDLQVKIDELKKTIEGEENKLAQLGSQLAAPDLASEAAERLGKQRDELTKNIAALKEKLKVWSDKLAGGE